MIVQRISCATGESCLPILAHRNWVEANEVHVNFDIRHRGTSILLDFKVQEPQVKATCTEINSPVWEDSCVEFFLALGDDRNYYNFEINAIGTVLGAYGPGRNSREYISPGDLSQISCTPSLGKGIIVNLEGGIKWELGIVIPAKVLIHHRITDLAGIRARGNFYKCGNGLDNPHFLSWMPVNTDKPDFHRPEFFGDLEFAP